MAPRPLCLARGPVHELSRPSSCLSGQSPSGFFEHPQEFLGPSPPQLKFAAGPLCLADNLGFFEHPQEFVCLKPLALLSDLPLPCFEPHSFRKSTPLLEFCVLSPFALALPLPGIE